MATDWASIGTQVGGALLGIGLNQQGQNQQMQNTKELMGIQHHNQQALNTQMQGIQQQNWDYTNYENQVKHMKNAGLNVGLMNSNSGGGGSTMGGGSGGSAAMGATPQNNAPAVMGMALQGAMMQSTIDLQKAQAEKLRVEATKLGGADTGNVLADTALKNMNTANAALQNKLQTESYEYLATQIKANADKAQSEARSAMIGANIDEKTVNDQIDRIKAEALNEAFKMTIAKSGISVNEQSIEKMKQDILTNQFNAQTNADFQGLDKVAGGQLTRLINWFNIKPDNQRTIK